MLGVLGLLLVLCSKYSGSFYLISVRILSLSISQWHVAQVLDIATTLENDKVLKHQKMKKQSKTTGQAARMSPSRTGPWPAHKKSNGMHRSHTERLSVTSQYVLLSGNYLESCPGQKCDNDTAKVSGRGSPHNMLQAKRCGLIQNWHILNDCPKTRFRNVQPSLHPLPCHLHVADQGSPSELWCSLSHEKDTHLTEIAPPLKSTVVMFKPWSPWPP